MMKIDIPRKQSYGRLLQGMAFFLAAGLVEGGSMRRFRGLRKGGPGRF